MHAVLSNGTLEARLHIHHAAEVQVQQRVPSSHGRALGSPKQHALASPKRTHAAAGSPKPNKTKLGEAGVRTVSRGKRPGSAAATNSALRTAKNGGSAQRSNLRAGGSRLGGTMPSHQPNGQTNLGFSQQNSETSAPTGMHRTAYKDVNRAKVSNH